MNLTDKVPKRLQPELRHRLRAVWNAPSRHECELRRDELARWLHAAGQDPAAETLFRDWDDFTTFFDFPAEHSAQRARRPFPHVLRLARRSTQKRRTQSRTHVVLTLLHPEPTLSVGG